MTKKKYQHKKTKDNTPNPKYVDLLDVDKPIAGQLFGCFSFISPEKLLKQRELFYFEQFLKQWDINKSMEKFHQFLNFVSFKYKINAENLIKDFEEFVKEEKETVIKSSSIEDDYKTFLDREEESLMKQFNIKHNFQTSVRGFKARGNFASQEEAELRAKLLREGDPHFDIFVGPVGTWLPWEPEAYKTGNVEYMEDELNHLAHEKKKNEETAKHAFEQRIKETKEKAIEENKKNAEKYGNSITQDIDEDGNLIGVEEEKGEFEKGDIDDITEKLFNTDNVVIGKTDHGEDKLIGNPFAKFKEDKKDD
jgi:hypothetical protein